MKRTLFAIGGLTLGLSLAGAPRAFAANVILHVAADSNVLEGVGDAAENGDAVSHWLDQSASVNDMTLAGAQVDRPASTAPTFLTNQVNGKPAVQFNAAPERLAAPSSVISGTMDYSMFAVINIASSNENIFGGNFGVANNSGVEFYSYVYKLYKFKGVGGAVPSVSNLSINTWYLVYAERSGPDFTIRINDVFEGTNALTFGGVGSAARWYMGDGPDFAAVAGPNFLIAEQIIYDDNLSDIERRNVALSMAEKYALPIPEPASGAALAAGSIVLAMRRRRV